MANPNALIVEVIGDTSKLKAGLRDANAQLSRFAGQSKIKSTGADAFLASVRGDISQAGALQDRLQKVDEQAVRTDASLRRMGVGSVVAGFAVNILGRNLADTSGNLAKFGSALSDLSTGNIVGFVKGLQSINATDPKKLAADLVGVGDAARATAIANNLASAGFDDLAASAREAAKQITATELAARKLIPFAAIASGTFGVTSLEHVNPDPKDAAKRKGITVAQRNQFFDDALGRSLDRVQDADLRDQVTKLNAISATITDRISVTKDITRKLKLEDDLASVVRQRKGVEETIAANAAARVEAARAAAAALKREREARAQALAEAKRLATQSKQFRALGFASDGSDVVPGVANLRKQLGTLTERLAGSNVNLSSKLESQLGGVRKVLSGQFGAATRESRDRIQDLFATIRSEFEKGAKSGGPLTATTQINSDRILAGLGLGAQTERQVRARLSHFNSAGKGLAGAGAGSGSIVVQPPDIILDGQKISKSTSKRQKRGAKLNPSQRNGPNAGLVIT